VEFLRLIYRFFGESVDAEAMLREAAKQKDDQGVNPGGAPSGASSGGFPTSKIKDPSQPSAGAEGGDTSLWRLPAAQRRGTLQPPDEDPKKNLKDKIDA